MKISRAGSEFVHIPVSGAPYDAAPLSVSFDEGASWNPATWDNAKTSVSILVSGPDADSMDGVVLPVGRHPVEVRLTDAPEIVVRSTNGIVEVR